MVETRVQVKNILVWVLKYCFQMSLQVQCVHKDSVHFTRKTGFSVSHLNLMFMLRDTKSAATPLSENVSTNTCFVQWRSQPKNIMGDRTSGGGKLFDFRRITLFCLEKRLSKHKVNIFPKILRGMASFPPWLRLWFC